MFTSVVLDQAGLAALTRPPGQSPSLHDPCGGDEFFELPEAAERQADGRQQVFLGDRLHQVGRDVGLDRALDELRLAVGGQQDDGDGPLAGDLLRDLDAVHEGHVACHDLVDEVVQQPRRPPARRVKALHPTAKRRPREPPALEESGRRLVFFGVLERGNVAIWPEPGQPKCHPLTANLG